MDEGEIITSPLGEGDAHYLSDTAIIGMGHGYVFADLLSEVVKFDS